MATPSSCTTLVHATLVQLGDESGQGTYLAEKYGWCLSGLFCSVTFSVGSEFPVPICDVAPKPVSRVKAMRGGNVQSGSSGIWKPWVFGVQWMNIEPCFWTDTFCLPCLLNSYCMWCSINNVFWNYGKPILKEKHSYWISTVIYLPALLPPQWLNISLTYFPNVKQNTPLLFPPFLNEIVRIQPFKMPKKGSRTSAQEEREWSRFKALGGFKQRERVETFKRHDS